MGDRQSWSDPVPIWQSPDVISTISDDRFLGYFVMRGLPYAGIWNKEDNSVYLCKKKAIGIQMRGSK